MGAGSGTTSHAGEEAGKGGDHPRVPGKVTVYSVSHRDQFRNVLHTLQPALRAAKEPVQRPRFATLRSERDDDRSRLLGADCAANPRPAIRGGASSPGN